MTHSGEHHPRTPDGTDAKATPTSGASAEAYEADGSSEYAGVDAESFDVLDGEQPPREVTRRDLKIAAKKIRKLDDDALIDVASKAHKWDTHGGDMEKLRAEADRNREIALRSQAEFENLQKRTQRLRQEEAKYAQLPLIRDLIGHVDNLRRAVDAAGANGGEGDTLLRGVQMTLAGLEQALLAHDALPIDATGQAFDPEFHDAVMTGADTSLDDGLVLDCFERGWKVHDRVIRPAKVRVNKLSE